VNAAPLVQPVCESFTANNYSVVKGTEITLSWTANVATVSVDGFNDWTRTGMPRNGSQTIVPNKATNLLSIRCNGAPGTTADTRTITVTTFEAPVCPSTVDYTPAGG